MRGKWRSATLLLILAFSVYLGVILLVWFDSLSAGSPFPTAAPSFVILVGLLSQALLAAVVGIIGIAWRRAIGRLGRDLDAQRHGLACQAVDPGRHPDLAGLLPAINAVLAALLEARAEVGRTVAAATAASEAEKARLAAILNDLTEGVVVCNSRHQVVLYNHLALRLLHVAGEIGLGRPLLGLVMADPILHVFDQLSHHSEGQGMPFVTATPDGRALLQGRMTLVQTDGQVQGYAISFVDSTDSIQALSRRDALLRQCVDLLEAAAERLRTLAGDMGAQSEMAAARQVAADFRALLTAWWPMTDLHSPDLVVLVIRRLGDAGLRVVQTGLPLSLKGDSHTLVAALEALIRHLASGSGVTAFDIEALSDDGLGWLCLAWEGRVMDAETVRDLQRIPISQGAWALTVGDVVGHHAPVAPRAEYQEGRCRLKIPVPLGRQDRVLVDLPSRPEFFDFDLLAQGRAELAATAALKDVTFVVFDTETTGLHPAQGDGIVSLAAVRVVNGRILTGEAFNRIVNPGRPIPVESQKFHGIDDEMVVGKPPIGVVLRQFKAYAADAVLVAHNAAFDLSFIRMREAESGVVFDNPVLDTMLLSSWIDSSTENQSLDAIAQRYGIPVTDRHTALGDSLVTAAILLRLLAVLGSRGIATLDQAVKTLDLTMQLHDRCLAVGRAEPTDGHGL